MGAWSILEAVNHVLEAGGEAPVNNLGTDSSSSVAVVLRNLKTERLKLLSRGHTFNTTYPYMTPDINGKIAIGDEILSVDGWQEDQHRAFTVKNGYLYDVDNETDVFTQQVHLKLLSDVDFDDLRTQVQYQLMASVAKSFQRRYQQDQIIDADLIEDEREAEVAAAEEEVRGANINPKDTTPLGRILKAGIMGYD